jgi:hypothetical protein
VEQKHNEAKGMEVARIFHERKTLGNCFFAWRLFSVSAKEDQGQVAIAAHHWALKLERKFLEVNYEQNF